LNISGNAEALKKQRNTHCNTHEVFY